MPKKRLQVIIGSLIALLVVVNIYIFRDKLSFLADIFANFDINRLGKMPLLTKLVV